MSDYLVKALLAEKKILAVVGITTELCEKARRIQNSLPTATAALGRALSLAGLLSATLKGRQSLSIQIISHGPLKGIFAQCDWKGNVRGYVKRPFIHLALTKEGKLNVEKAVGLPGMLYLIRDLGLKEPFIGSSALISGGIAKDLAYYFYTSEQKPSACGAGVYVDTDNSVKAAGGFIVQPIFDVDASLIDNLELNIEKLPFLSELVLMGKSAEEILSLIAKDIDCEIVEKKELRYACNCNKEKCQEAIATLKACEIKTFFEKQKVIEVFCNFCGERYYFNEKELLDKKESS